MSTTTTIPPTSTTSISTPYIIDLRLSWKELGGGDEYIEGVNYANLNRACAYTCLFVPQAPDPIGLMAIDPRIPELGSYWSFYPAMAGCILRRRRFRMLSPILGQAILEFSGVNDPISMPPKKNWRTEVVEEPADVGPNGQPLRNTAGTPIIGYSRPFYDDVYVFTRNETSSAYFAGPSGYRGTTNSKAVSLDKYTGLAANTCLLYEINGARKNWGSAVSIPPGPADPGYYWEVTYLIKYRASGWTQPVINEGPYCWDGTCNGDGTRHLAKCMIGGVEGIGRLDMSGMQLADVDSGGRPIPAIILNLPKYGSADWTPLGIT